MELLNNIEQLINDSDVFTINNDLIVKENEKEENNKQKENEKEENNKQKENEKEENNKETDKESKDSEEEIDFNEDDNFDSSFDDSNMSLDDLGKVQQLKDIFNELLNLYDITFKILLFDNNVKYLLNLIKKLLDNYKFIINNIEQFKNKLDSIINHYRRITTNIYKYLNIKIVEIEKNVENV